MVLRTGTMTTVRGVQFLRNLNSNTASITKPHRLTYVRTNPTVLVFPNGSTITIRHTEPKQILKMPLNIWTLSEAERKAKLEQRKPKQRVKIEDDYEDTYDSNKYLKFIKK